MHDKGVDCDGVTCFYDSPLGLALVLGMEKWLFVTRLIGSLRSWRFQEEK